MNVLAVLLFLAAQNDPVVIRTVEAPRAESFPALELPEGEIGVVLGAAPADLMAAAGFSAVPAARGGVSFSAEPKAGAVWISSLSREKTAAVLREAKGIPLCIVTGRGGGDPEPLKIGETWMVQAPGGSGLWGRIELRAGSVSNRFGAPDGRKSDKVAALRKSAGSVESLRAGAKPAPAPEAAPRLETANRACTLKLLSVSERSGYGPKTLPAGRKLLVLDAEFENTIPMTLIQSNQVPTMYKVKDLADHLYLVVNGNRVSRLYPDASSLAGHVQTVGFTLDRLGTRARGNLVFEIPEAGVETLDLRFYDYAHGHMAVTLKPGARPEEKAQGALQSNDILEAGLFQVLERGLPEKNLNVTTTLLIEFRARSRMFTEGDATAFDPKAKPGDKIQIGTVSDWTELRKHIHVLVEGTRSYGPTVNELEIGEAPRFLPDVLTGGVAAFEVPAKASSIELRCDFPNARLPNGQVVHPKPLIFPLRGTRPETPMPAAIVEIDDDVFKVAVTGQSTAAEFAGAKAPAGSTFLILDVWVTGAGKAGEMFQTFDQLHYATEKGVQLNLHDATFKGVYRPEKLHLVPTGERRAFQVVFAIPSTDKRPRLAYRGVSKAQIVNLKALEGPAPAEAEKRVCPKCKAPATPNEKFCGECGTKLDPK